MPRKEYPISVDLGHVFLFPGNDQHSLPTALAGELAVAANKFLEQGGYRVQQEQEQLLRKYKLTLTVVEETE